MTRAHYIHGPRKQAFDLRLSLRVVEAARRRYGLLDATRRLRRYLQDERSLLGGAPDRYLRRGADTFALPDLPPMNTAAFVRYLLDDMEALQRSGPAPLTFALLSISSRCPYRCRYCYNLQHHSEDELLPLPVIVRTIRGLARQGVQNVFLSGGEPMCRWEELPELLQACTDGRTGFWILSTGWGMSGERLARLQTLGLRGVLISLDSRHKDRCVSSKGHPEAFDKAVSAIRTASELGLLVGVNAVAGRDLLQEDEFAAMLRFLGDLGAHWLNCYSPHPVPSAGDDALRSFDHSEFLQLGELTRASQRGAAFRDTPLAYYPDAWEALRGCLGGSSFVYMDPTGAVTACPFIEQVAGNVLEEEIGSIVARMRSEERPAGCSVCASFGPGCPDSIVHALGSS